MKKLLLTTIYYILATSARRVMRRFNPFVIAVTGSVGKTSAKEAIFAVLDAEMGGEVRKNYGNLNAEIGVPLTILGYDKVPNKYEWPIFLVKAIYQSFVITTFPKYLILEMGVEHPGDMEYLTSIAKPNLAVITSLAGAHLQYFESKKQYQAEKLSIINKVAGNGRIIINGDDPDLADLHGESITRIGISGRLLDYRAEDIKLSLEGTEYRIAGTGHKIAVKTEALGEQLVYAQLTAFAVADSLKLSVVKIGKALSSVKRVPGRMNPLEGTRETMIIDDTYNAASPASVKAALDFLAKVSYPGRKVAILGTMNELGAESEEIHGAIGEYAKDRCDLAVFVGRNAPIMAERFYKSKSKIFANREEAINNLDNVIEPRDLVLVKASQGGNFFEEIVKALMKDKGAASKLLVRQGKEWMRRKSSV